MFRNWIIFARCKFDIGLMFLSSSYQRPFSLYEVTIITTWITNFVSNMSYVEHISVIFVSFNEIRNVGLELKITEA